MKKAKTVLFTLSAFFITGNAIAQLATLSDFAANWSGIGSNGNTYTMTLNRNNTASIKTNNSITLDVAWWKLNFNDSGIAYDKSGHVGMRLISNASNSSALSPNTVSTTPGSSSKTYYADVFYDVSRNTLTMTVDFSNPGTGGPGNSPITINFTK